jgi:hypothetical protein
MRLLQEVEKLQAELSGERKKVRHATSDR